MKLCDGLVKARLIYLIAALFLVSCGSEKVANLSGDSPKEVTNLKVTAQSILSQMDKGRYSEGELLVKFKSGVATTVTSRTHQTLGAAVLKRFSVVPNLEHVKLPEGLSVRDAVIKYMSDPGVEYAEPNYIRRATATVPNDTYFGQQWALRNTGQFANGTPGADIKGPEAWDISKGSSSVVIAVIDTGIDYNHPDLVGNIWTNPGENPTNGVDDDSNGYIDDFVGWDFTTCAKFNATGACVTPKPQDNNPMDDNGHGTHVAGIIGAKGNNGTGIAGLMWNVKLMALKALNADGEGTIADEIGAIQYAVAKGAKVINASFSGSEYSNAEFDAISSANNASVLVMAAAGNDGGNNDLAPEYPASYNLPNIISVAATDQNDNRATFSNFGLNSVHVAAPGVYILSTVPTSLWPTGYDFLSGTSMSTPFVSGLAGLLYSYYTNFTYSQIRSTILRYVDTLPTLSGWIRTGGRINAYRAVSSLLTPTNLTATVISSSTISLSWTDNATGEDGYKLERKIGTGPYTEITTLGVNATSYTNSGLTDGTQYSYRVRAYNTIPADSFYSNEATAVTPLNPPTGLTATALSSSQVSLAWVDNSQSEEGYRIERKGSDGNYSQIAVVGPNTTSYTDSGLSPATAYWYRVRAYNTAAGNSLYSNEPSVTTLTATGESTGGGGGGCTIGARQDGSTRSADIAVLLIPLLIISMLRRRR
ncbi:MAG: hypothetical protein OHK0032_07290 [Thermodesulfovibrionales bacterium]